MKKQWIGAAVALAFVAGLAVAQGSKTGREPQFDSDESGCGSL